MDEIIEGVERYWDSPARERTVLTWRPPGQPLALTKCWWPRVVLAQPVHLPVLLALATNDDESPAREAEFVGYTLGNGYGGFVACLGKAAHERVRRGEIDPDEAFWSTTFRHSPSHYLREAGYDDWDSFFLSKPRFRVEGWLKQTSDLIEIHPSVLSQARVDVRTF